MTCQRECYLLEIGALLPPTDVNLCQKREAAIEGIFPVAPRLETVIFFVFDRAGHARRWFVPSSR